MLPSGNDQLIVCLILASVTGSLLLCPHTLARCALNSTPTLFLIYQWYTVHTSKLSLEAMPPSFYIPASRQFTHICDLISSKHDQLGRQSSVTTPKLSELSEY